MATVGTAIATLQQPLLPLPAQGATFAPQSNATPVQGVPQTADTVTLTGRTAEPQQAGTQGDGAQLAETAAFFVAERQSFRAANGSTNTQPSANVPVAPELPVKMSEEGLAAAQAQPVAPQSAPQQPTPGTPAATAANQLTSTAYAAQVTTESAATAGGASPASTGTPMAELAQLDRTLQDIGINPQSISLFNRMAILLYANDPAALRILVKTLQNGPGSGVNTPGNGSPSANEIAVSQPATVASPPPPPPPQAQVQDVGSQIRALLPQPDANANSAANTANQGAASTQPSTQNDSVVASSGGTGNAQLPSQPASYSPQFADLQSAFAAVGALQLSSSQQAQASGQFLNITA